MTTSLLPTNLVDWLDDLCVRFLLNLPASELSSVPRLCFQVEEAQWFYEDFVRPAVQASGAPPLPSLTLREFCLLLFQHCPLLSGFTDAQHLAAYEEFLAYKVRVPVRGAILLDERMEKLVLVRGWKKGASWSFPRGKINKDEKDLDCAMREVYEETGYDIAASGLLPRDYNPERDESGHEGVKYIDITMREQHIRLFVFRGVPEDAYFETKTRKEISKIAWYAIKDLPGFKKHKNHSQQSEVEAAHANKFYMVAPFLGPLKKWIHQQRRNDIAEAQKQASRNSAIAAEMTGTEDDTEDQMAQTGVQLDRQREDDLKRMLDIAPAPSPAHSHPSGPPDARSGNLLALLQGGAPPTNGSSIPHTPFDQMNAFPPPEPGTPQPQHFRHPSIGQYQNQPGPLPPQFPLSPQPQLQAPPRNYPIPTPNIFGAPNLPPNNHPHQFSSGAIQPHHQQPQEPWQRFPSRPNLPPQNGPFGPPNHFQSPYPGQQANQNPLPANPPPLITPQGPQGAIANGPAVPKASQLPPPRMNAHAMRLLDAFKTNTAVATGNKNPSVTPTPSGPGHQREASGSTHQTALLDLFKKPAVAAPAIGDPADATSSVEEATEPPLSPALTDVTEKPLRRPGAAERKQTLNEITRTLPTIPVGKAKAAPTVDVSKAEDFPPLGESNRKALRAPIDPSRKLFDPDADARAAGEAETKAKMSPPTPKRILQRPPSREPSSSRSPLPVSAASTTNPRTVSPLSPTKSSVFSKPSPANTQNGQPPAPGFTILARPGSSNSKSGPPKSPLTPTSPRGGRNDVKTRVGSASNTATPKAASASVSNATFLPQVLKRPQSGVVEEAEKRLGNSGNPAIGTKGSVEDGAVEKEEARRKKEQLLALFGKGNQSQRGGVVGGQQSADMGMGSVNEGTNEVGKQTGGVRETNKDALLGLFTTPVAASTSNPGKSITTTNPSHQPAPAWSAALPTTSPPPAPRLSPSLHRADLDANSRAQSTSPAAAAAPPPPRPKSQQNLLLDLFHQPPSRQMASMNTAERDARPSPVTPISPFVLGTPAAMGTVLGGGSGGEEVKGEDRGGRGGYKDKDFLLGYLNGVVRGQGGWDGR